MEYDIFISHASEDKMEFVRPLAERLRSEGYRIWYDEFELKLGDILTEKIDYGLAHSKAGIVVVSQSFIAKKWPQRELNGLFTRQLHEGTVLIPILHEMSRDDLISFSPPLAGIIAANSSQGFDYLVVEIKRVIQPSGLNINGNTIEEAQMLLEMGSYKFAIMIAFYALDSRVMAIFQKLKSEGKIESHHYFRQPNDVLIYLWRNGFLVLSDGETSYNLEDLTFAEFFDGKSGYMGTGQIDGSDARNVVNTVRGILRLNPI